MNTDQLLIRGAAWLAMALYAVTMLAARRSKGRAPIILWSIGCAIFLAHVIAAFALAHHWSHADAAEATRRQTQLVTGVDSGVGIWFNYLFAAIWLGDALAWWLIGPSFRRRFPRWNRAVQLWFLFMAINATIIFAHGLARIAGVLICAAATYALIAKIPRKKVSGGVYPTRSKTPH